MTVSNFKDALNNSSKSVFFWGGAKHTAIQMELKADNIWLDEEIGK